MDVNERRKRASREAADWWALLQADDMTKAEREDFIDWLRDSQTNIAEILRLSQVHGVLSHFEEWADISTDRSPTEGHENIVSLPTASPAAPGQDNARMRNLRRGWRLVASAATIAALVVVTALFLPQLRGQWIVTERGERREVVLDDGSVIHVDPQTRLNVRFDKQQRQVVLSEGRAVFRVAKNPHRPFRVEAGGTTVRAIGTAFGVDRRASDHVVVTVSEGKVAVFSTNVRLKPHQTSSLPPSSSGREGATDAPNGAAPSTPPREVRRERREQQEDEVYLTANEQITVAMTQLPQAIRAVDSQRELAWAEGRLVFKNDTVAHVIAEFNRYNRVQLTVTDPAIAARPITGVFDAANVEGFLAFLRNAAPVRIERDEERSIVISPSGSP